MEEMGACPVPTGEDGCRRAPTSRLGAARCRAGERTGRVWRGASLPRKEPRDREERAFSLRPEDGAALPSRASTPTRYAEPGSGSIRRRGREGTARGGGIRPGEVMTERRPQPIKGARRAAGWGSFGWRSHSGQLCRTGRCATERDGRSPWGRSCDCCAPPRRC